MRGGRGGGSEGGEGGRVRGGGGGKGNVKHEILHHTDLVNQECREK